MRIAVYTAIIGGYDVLNQPTQPQRDNVDFICFSDREMGDSGVIQNKLDEYNLPMFYWTSDMDSGFDFIKALDMRHIDTRIQLYIKTKAKFNVGNQTGMNDTIANYAPTYTVPIGKLGSNIIKSEIYLK